MDDRRGSYQSHTREVEVNIGTRTEQALAILDTWSVVNEDGQIRPKVYRKEMHMDQYYALVAMSH